MNQLKTMLSRMTAGALCAALAANPAAAQRVAIETGPAPIAGAAGAAAVSVSALPTVSAPTIGVQALPALSVSPSPAAALGLPALQVPAALPQAQALPLPLAAEARVAVSAAAALPAAAAAPAAAAGLLRESARIAPAIPQASQLERGGTASAHESGVRLEDAITLRRSRASSSEETPVAGRWASLAPSGLIASLGSARLGLKGIPGPGRGIREMSHRRQTMLMVTAATGVLFTLAAAGAGAIGGWSFFTALHNLFGFGAAAAFGGLGAATAALMLGATLPDDRSETQKKVDAVAPIVAKVRAEIGGVIVGQKEMIDAIILSAIAGEHVLLEGVPGVAKTATVRAFSDATEGQFQRIQGTPDKLPSDILGAEILQEDPQTGAKAIKLEKGPIFTNILLVDEINRMMPKTQAALLEAMQERRVTIGKQSMELPAPFILLATQNPLEQEGVYPLPEAQQDRFMMKVIVNRPTKDELKEIMRRFNSPDKAPKAGKVTTLEEFMMARRVAEEIYISPELEDAIANIVEATNDPGAYGLDLKDSIENGASPRAAINLLKAARISALLDGRAHVERSDLFAVAPSILRHRLKLGYQAQAAGVSVEQIIAKVLAAPKVWNEPAPPAGPGVGAGMKH